jgi:hypothetical protein
MAFFVTNIYLYCTYTAFCSLGIIFHSLYSALVMILGIHLHAATWAALGNRSLDSEVNSPIIAGRTVLPVTRPIREKLFTRIGAADATADDTRDFFARLATAAAEVIKADTERLATEVKEYRAVVAKNLKGAADCADVATVQGTIAEIDEIVGRPESDEVRNSQSMAENLRDALDDYGADLDFDAALVHAAIACFDKALSDRATKLDTLRDLRRQAQALLEVARDPATLRRLREAGQEVAVRGVVGSLLADMRSAREQAAAAVARIDSITAILEAVQ